MLDDLLAGIPQTQDGVIALVSGLGGTGELELRALSALAHTHLTARGTPVASLAAGVYATALDMAGFSITLTRLASGWLELWTAPSDTPLRLPGPVNTADTLPARSLPPGSSSAARAARRVPLPQIMERDTTRHTAHVPRCPVRHPQWPKVRPCLSSSVVRSCAGDPSGGRSSRHGQRKAVPPADAWERRPCACSIRQPTGPGGLPRPWSWSSRSSRPMPWHRTGGLLTARRRCRRSRPGPDPPRAAARARAVAWRNDAGASLVRSQSAGSISGPGPDRRRRLRTRGAEPPISGMRRAAVALACQRRSTGLGGEGFGWLRLEDKLASFWRCGWAAPMGRRVPARPSCARTALRRSAFGHQGPFADACLTPSADKVPGRAPKAR